MRNEADERVKGVMVHTCHVISRCKGRFQLKSYETATGAGMLPLVLALASRSLMLMLTRLSFGFGDDDIVDVGGALEGTVDTAVADGAVDGVLALVVDAPPPIPTPKLSGLALLCALGGIGGFAAATAGQIDTLRAGIDVERVREDLRSASVDDDAGVDAEEDGAGAGASAVAVEEYVGASEGTGFRSGFFVACGDGGGAGSCLFESVVPEPLPDRRLLETATSSIAPLLVLFSSESAPIEYESRCVS